MKLKPYMLCSFLLIYSYHILAQKQEIPDFEFSSKWGTYGHYKVSSKENKVYVKVQHSGVYTDTTIYFTQDDKAKIWEKLTEIEFFSYPDDYRGCDFESDIEPDFFVDYDYYEDEESGIFLIDSTSADTIWEIGPIYFCEETIIPYGEYAITIYKKDETKTIEWNGGIEIYYNDGEKNVYLENPKYDRLFELGNLIWKTTVHKQGFKNLPKSNLRYY